MTNDTSAQIDVSLRAMTPEDLDRVTALERLTFSDPWPRQSFEEILANPSWHGLVACAGGNIVGYAMFLVVSKEAHLANISVDPAWRRKSVARRLLEHILSVVRAHGCELLLLEVRVSNQPAITFYARHGFREMYRRKNYYRQPPEDALVMVMYFDEPS